MPPSTTLVRRSTMLERTRAHDDRTGSAGRDRRPR
jgi:hypothetical protein